LLEATRQQLEKTASAKRKAKPEKIGSRVGQAQGVEFDLRTQADDQQQRILNRIAEKNVAMKPN
jgi:hypothetical protein